MGYFGSYLGDEDDIADALSPSSSLIFAWSITRDINGVPTLTDADSLPLLSDVGGTYGVRRLDTGAVVVPAETVAGAISHDGTGRYSYTLTNVTPGVKYQLARLVTLLGNTEPSTVIRTAGGTAHYGDRAGGENWYGSIDFASYFDIDSDGVATKISAAIDYGLAQTDLWIRKRFREKQVALPDSSSPNFEALAPIANEYVGAWGYFKRGWTDKNSTARNAMDGMMQGHMDHAEAELSSLIALLEYGGNTVSAPVAEANTYWPTMRACVYPYGPICG